MATREVGKGYEELRGSVGFGLTDADSGTMDRCRLGDRDGVGVPRNGGCDG